MNLARGLLVILYNMTEKNRPRHEPNSIQFLIIWLANVAVWKMIYIAEILRYEPEDLPRQCSGGGAQSPITAQTESKLN